MDREILFKGKRVDNGEWIYGLTLQWSGDADIQHEKRLFLTPDGCSFPIEVDAKTICQYTGLTDKNDKKIWENDMLRYSYDYPGSYWLKEKGLTDDDIKYHVGAVFWQEWRGTWAVCAFGKNRGANSDVFTYCRNPNRVEVVGNIFDNPELLEGGRT